MVRRDRGDRQPDPRAAADQAEFRHLLRELMRWAGCGSLHQLETAAERRGLSMPVSTADRALSTDRLPTADFVRRFVAACKGDVELWVATRDVLADRRYARDQPAQTRRPPDSPGDPNPLRDVCPFPGLASFTQEQAHWFFGRERETAEMVGQLTGRPAGTGPLVVTGPSGSGKSSLLRAGLLPALGRGALPGSAHWPQLSFTPTADPVGELVDQVKTLPGADADLVREGLLTDPGRLAAALRRSAAVTDANGRVVLVVDQFEEVFSLCPDEHHRRAFIEALCAATGDALALVVLGLRADFYGHCAAYPELVEALRHGQVLLGAMSAAHLREAIEKPARAAGLTIQPGLVDVILADLGAPDCQARHEPGALPLLAHALFATWQQRAGEVLTLDGYRLTGGIYGAVAATAERAYRALDPARQRVARQVLMRMIQIGDGTDDTRRRLDRTALVAESTDAAATNDVLAALAAARLVTLDANTAEIAHEALLRAWPRLRAWIDTDRTRLLVVQRLTEAARAWDSEGRDPSALYRGSRLAGAREWITASDLDLTALAREFLTASGEQELAEQRAAQRRTRRLHQLTAALGVLLLLATVATGYAIQSRNSATDQRDDALSAKVANEANALRTTNPALAAQLSLAAYQLSPTPAARGSLTSAWSGPYATRLTGFTSGTRGVLAARFSPDGRTLATGSDDRTLRLWDVTDRHRPGEVTRLDAHADGVSSLAFRHDGAVLATASRDRTVKLWAVTDRRGLRELAVLTEHSDSVSSVAFSPDGRALVTAGGDRTVRLWDVSDPHHPRALGIAHGHSDGVSAAAFSPTRPVIASTSYDRTVRLWDISDPNAIRPITTLTDHTDRVLSLAFSPDGRTLATGGFDNTVRVWDATDPWRPQGLTALARHSNGVIAIAFSSDGRTMATGSYDSTARLWDLTDLNQPSEPLVLAGHGETVYSLAFAPDGHTLATASRDNTARLWHIDGPVFGGQSGIVSAIGMSADGRLLVTGSYQHARIWDLTAPPSSGALTLTKAHDDGVFAASFSPDGRLLATASLDSTVKLWAVTDPRSPQQLAILTGHTGNVLSAVFTADSKTLITTGVDQTIRLWDVAAAERVSQPTVLKGHTAAVNSVAVTPDGRMMVTAGDDRTVRLWDTSDRGHPTELTALVAHEEGVRSVALVAEKHLMATASYDRTVRLWDIRNPRSPALLSVIKGHTDRVVAIAISPDNQTLATASFDRTAALWRIADPRNPELSALLTGHTDRVSAVAFRPDGRAVVTGAHDRTARLWNTDTAEVAAKICATVQPTITEAEWSQYFPGLPFRRPC